MLNNTQRNILKILKEEPGIKLKDLTGRLNLSSITNVHNQIKKLIEMGNLEKLGRQYIVKEDGTVPLSYIPYYGLAQCGTTDILPEEKIIDYIPMPTKFLPGNIDGLFFIKGNGQRLKPLIRSLRICRLNSKRRKPLRHGMMNLKKNCAKLTSS